MLWLQERCAATAPRLAARVPPLTELETLLFRTIAVGFALLTLTLLTGALFVENLFAQHLVHKTVLSLLSWLVFGGFATGALAARLARQHRRALDPGGDGPAAAGLFGNRFVLELLLLGS